MMLLEQYGADLLNASDSGSSSQQHSMLMALLTGPMHTYRVFSSCVAQGTVIQSRPDKTIVYTHKPLYTLTVSESFQPKQGPIC